MYGPGGNASPCPTGAWTVVEAVPPEPDAG